MTKKTSIAALLCGALAIPAFAVADEPSPTNEENAAKFCKSLRKASGEENFKAMFGGKSNAFGKCVSKAARTDQKQEETAKTNAAKQCKAEKAMSDEDFAASHGGKTFDQFYATNKKGSNAYGKCVSVNAKANKAEADDKEKDSIRSAKTCKAEQSQAEEDFKAAHDGKTFAEFYGTNENDSNAFGQCVKKKNAERKAAREAEEGGATS